MRKNVWRNVNEKKFQGGGGLMAVLRDLGTKRNNLVVIWVKCLKMNILIQIWKYGKYIMSIVCNRGYCQQPQNHKN